jgi:hypothetical protein
LSKGLKKFTNLNSYTTTTVISAVILRGFNMGNSSSITSSCFVQKTLTLLGTATAIAFGTAFKRRSAQSSKRD